MLKISGKHALLLLIVALAFVYRFTLMTMNTFPPGADIGLHESVIKSIAVGRDGFFWNYYQMGGGVSATNPGYHIFVSYVVFSYRSAGAFEFLILPWKPFLRRHPLLISVHLPR